MTAELVIAICTALGLILTIGGFTFALGQRDARIRVLEERLQEDRENNSDEHREFYASKERVAEMSTLMTEFSRRLNEIENGVKEILDRLPRRE